MQVNLPFPEAASLVPVAGIRLGAACAGIKAPDRKDLLVIALRQQSTVAGVFPRNRFSAAPVTVAKAHLAHYKVPKSVDFEAELPRLETGKLYKRLLKDRYWGKHDSRIV